MISRDEVEEFLNLTQGRAVCTDSRELIEGNVFLAIKGENFDGDDFVEQALAKGASFAFSSRAFSDKRVRRVADTRDLLIQAASELLSRVSLENKVAITGSNGKTTTKEVTAFLLSSIAKTFKTSRNFNTEIGLPLSIIREREKLLSARFGVFEIGTNKEGDIKKLVELVEPDTSVLLNVGTAHLGNFESVEKLLKEKLTIFDSPGMERAVTNCDDSRLKKIAASFKTKKLFFGRSCGDFALTDFSYEGDNTLVHFLNDGDKFLRLKGLWGSGQLLDFGAAYLVAKELGVVEPALEMNNFVLACEDRFKVLKLKGFTIVNDFYNSSLESWRAALDSIVKFDSKRKIAVAGSMLEQGVHSKDNHTELGKLLKSFDEVILFNCDPSIETVAQVLSPALVSSDPAEVALWLKKHVRAGDLIFLKASRAVALERVFEAFMELMRDGK